MFRDVNTKIPVDNSHILEPNAAQPDCVYMDAMGFGMGCCCLQLTFQACCIVEARTLYDQLAPLCPIMVCFYSYNNIKLLPRESVSYVIVSYRSIHMYTYHEITVL